MSRDFDSWDYFPDMELLFIEAYHGRVLSDQRGFKMIIIDLQTNESNNSAYDENIPIDTLRYELLLELCMQI